MADANKLAGQLKKLGEIRGPVPQELRDYLAGQNKAHKAILDALKDGPKTPPEIAAAAGLPHDKAIWHIAALRKYGRIADVPCRGDWPKYELKGGETK